MISRLLIALLIIGVWCRAEAQPAKPPAQLNTQTLSDANITIGNNITNVVTGSALTATRTATLPAASAVCKACTITVTDLAGAIATPGNNIIVAPNGSDTINGRTSLVLGQTYGAATLMSNGSNGWVAIGQAADVPNAAYATALNQLDVSQGPLALIKLSPLPPGSPGAGVGWIALTKGTNAGTCKLVALAGLSSTAVTILDNIGGGGLSQGGC